MLRVIIPDSHGSYIDKAAARAFLGDLAALGADEIVFIGDHVDCSGLWTDHPPGSLGDVLYSYEEDIEQASWLLDEVQKCAPGAAIHYLEGNHEQHVERWAARNVRHHRDAAALVEAMSPRSKLDLDARGIRYYSMDGQHIKSSIHRGIIRLGSCHFTHGSYHGLHATRKHLTALGVNLVHGHVHTASEVPLTLMSGTVKAWCPGTLAQLAPLYRHSQPTGHTHGYAFQSVLPSGRFQHVNVCIDRGVSLLKPLMKLLSA